MPRQLEFFALSCRITPELNAKIDEWRRQQRPQIPSLSDAVRELLLRGMGAVIEPPHKIKRERHNVEEATV
jgi:hypothetical protein